MSALKSASADGRPANITLGSTEVTLTLFGIQDDIGRFGAGQHLQAGNFPRALPVFEAAGLPRCPAVVHPPALSQVATREKRMTGGPAGGVVAHGRNRNIQSFVSIICR